MVPACSHELPERRVPDRRQGLQVQGLVRCHTFEVSALESGMLRVRCSRSSE